MTDISNPILRSGGDEYFADMPMFDDNYCAELWDRVLRFYRHPKTISMFDKMNRAYTAYYGVSTTGAGQRSDRVSRVGSNGELAGLRVNHFRNLGQHMLTLCCSQRPTPQPISTNTDAKSIEQTILASGLLEYYSREKRVERILKKAAESAIVLGEGYIKDEWDETAGQPYDKDENERWIHEGDLKFTNVTPYDVIKDVYADSTESLDWLMTRTWLNKYDLAAKFPECADEIMAVPAMGAESVGRRLGWNQGLNDGDKIPVFEFFHRKSDAVPDGRQTVFITGTILMDGALAYDVIPVRRIAPADHMGTPNGYTPMFDLLAMQEALDTLDTIILSNQSTFGTQNIVADEGANVSFEALAEGLNLITKAPNKLLEALELCKTPAEIFEYRKQLISDMETLSGINSTVRGNPEASLKSGSALALVQSQAIQFSSGLQQSYAQLVEDVFTDAITILAQYAKTKRVVAIVGKYNRHMLKSFSGEDLTAIRRVVVDSGSALSRTLSGRIQIAQDLLQNNLIKTPEEYLSVINSGKLEPITEAQTRELNNIRGENELLADGDHEGVVTAIDIDNHKLHITEHAAVLGSPEARTNPEVVQAVLGHIRQHVDLLKTVDPNLLMMLGQQSLAAPPPPPEQMAGGTPAKPPSPGPGGMPQMPQDGAAAVNLPTMENPPKQPQYPINPMTGQVWDPISGGGAIIPPQNAV
jgi:hypothetical protein